MIEARFGIFTVGTRFGKLVVMVSESYGDYDYPICQCDCGSDPIQPIGKALLSGLVTSCGCTVEHKHTKPSPAMLRRLKG